MTLTTRQEEIYKSLPATTEELAKEFEITESTVRDHLSSIKSEKGVEKAGDEWVANRPASHNKMVEETTKAEKTKKARRHLNELEERLLVLCAEVEEDGWSETVPDEEGKEDVVIHYTDSHIGRVEEDEFGEEIFNPEIAVNRIDTLTKKALRLVERQRSAEYDFGTVHMLLGGDLIDGEAIYPQQPHEIDATLDQQLNLAAQTYMKQIRRISDEFEAVQVVCQQGNHGSFGGQGASDAANADRILYLMLEKMVWESPVENVRFVRNNSVNFTNFEMRGHRAHLRHGHNSLAHIGTSSARDDWQTWLRKHEADIAYWGHYHSPEYDKVHGRPVLRSGSIKPDGDYEESRGIYGEPRATIHGVSDERPFTWYFPVDFKEE